jgi:diguanylate cyclase (GGDEF)-like protein
MAPASSPPSVIIAQCESFARKMPAFYAAIIACMIAQVIVFYGAAPLIAAVILPLAIAAVAGVRAIWWLDRRKRPFSEVEARSTLKRSAIILLVSAVSFIALSVFLYGYANEEQRAFLLVEAFGSAMAGIYCLMHVRSVAYYLACTMSVLLYLKFETSELKTAIGFSIVIICLICTMFYAMQIYYKDFQSLVRAKDENQRLANLDMLTDLPNRRQFFHDLDALCEQAGARGDHVAVAIADLDGFKPINDTHGHAIGDKVLRVIADRIAVRHGLFLRAYRLGGDEFALIAVGDADGATLLTEARDLIRTIGEPVELGELIVSTGCSIGIAVFPDKAPTPGLLYERADYALYHVKRSGRNEALLFTSEHEQQIRSQGAIEQALRSADLGEEFYLVFQPIVRSRDGMPLGFECLARWRSPILGEVSPGAFIPIAEQSGLIASLTPVLLRKALREALLWLGDLKVSFNLSPHDIASRERTRDIITLIRSSGVCPSRIDLELTESALLHNFDVVRENMEALKAVGANISLDDFGTGYSSLSHVHALPLDKIKIDRSFVRHINDNASSQTIVRSMLTLCRDLNMACIVEGVETLEQLTTLSELGCEQIQGYYFAKPMPASEVSRFLTRSPTTRCA